MNEEEQYHDIVEHNLALFTSQLVKRLMDGWAVSKTNPGDVVGFYGGTFTVSLYRNADTVKAFKDKAAGVQDIARPSRADILAKAREAKAAKKSSP